MRQDTLHLTLAFLGEVPEQRLTPLIAVGGTVARVTRPFVLTIDRLDCWSDKRLLWAGMSALPPALGELADTLRSALRDAGYAPDGGDRALSAHITLVRKLDLSSAPFTFAADAAIDWRCRGFTLARSRLSNDGSRYERIAEFAFAR